MVPPETRGAQPSTRHPLVGSPMRTTIWLAATRWIFQNPSKRCPNKSNGYSSMISTSAGIIGWRGPPRTRRGSVSHRALARRPSDQRLNSNPVASKTGHFAKEIRASRAIWPANFNSRLCALWCSGALPGVRDAAWDEGACAGPA